jgi:hypothetical protein
LLLNEIKHTLRGAGRSDYRKLGVSFGILLLLIAGYCWYREFASTLYVILAGILLILMGILLPNLLKPLYNGWMSLALAIGYLMSRILLTLIFYLVFTPVGLMMRLLKKDPLERKADPSAESYWVKRDKRKFDPKEAERQF